MSTMIAKRGFATRSGFTLLEMVIVVAILALLAGIAVRGMDGLDQQARFEATQRVMRDINDAVLASGVDADGSALVSGFVADMGRLPKAAAGPDGNLQLLELWSNPNNLQLFAVNEANNLQFNGSTYSDSEVFIASGWRGNYLRLGVGQTVLQDGWGNPFDLLRPDGTYVSAGDAIAAVRSRGSNGAVDTGPTTGYDADITVSLAPAGSSATVSGHVSWLDPSTGQLGDPTSGNGPVTVLFFGPDGAGGGPSVQAVTLTAATFTYSFQGSAGPRVIRAYQGSPATAGDWSTAPIKSVPVRLMLQPGGQAKDLVLK